MRDRKFSEISRDDVTQLLQRDDLTVNSEVELYESVARWGLKQAIKADQKPTPELIRQIIGPTIIKSIRFLTMTGPEFTKIHVSSRILDYAEGLVVLVNINSPGGRDMPTTLSSNTQKRKSASTRSEDIETGTFYSSAPGLATSKNSKDISDLYTITKIPKIPYTGGGTLNIIGIQIPKSLEARRDCTLREHFDVLILNSRDSIVYNFTYNDIPPCSTMRYKFDQGAVKDNTLISVKFSSNVEINTYNSYKIKVDFYDTREYPKWEDGGLNSTSSEYYTTGRTSYFLDEAYGQFLVLNNRFIYSIFYH
jgi:BTB And C-terminal Kelch